MKRFSRVELTNKDSKNILSTYLSGASLGEEHVLTHL